MKLDGTFDVRAKELQDHNKTKIRSYQKRVVIIDDCPKMTNYLEPILESDYQLEVISFNDEYEAVDYITAYDVDLVIIDINLNDTNGMSVKRVIKSLSSADISYIFISQDVNYRSLVENSDDDFPAFIQKPVASAILKRTVYNLLYRESYQNIV